MADPAKNTKNDSAPASKPRVEPEVVSGKLPEGFTPPAPTRGNGVASKYPFDSLEVGGAFGVKNKSKRQMASPINNAKKKYRTEAKDADGNVQKIQQRDFYAVDVDADTAKSLKGTEFEGATVLVVRSK